MNLLPQRRIHCPIIASLTVALAQMLLPQAVAQELRGWWVDAFNTGFKTSAQVTQLIADARAARVNALFVQVRKRGDAYYNSSFEPKASDVSPASFDPLADLLTKSRTGGTRVQIHAWVVTYNIWNGQSTTPTQTTHPYRVYPGWLTVKTDGSKWDGANYAFDQALPAVQDYTYNVLMDIVTKYDVDVLHLTTSAIQMLVLARTISLGATIQIRYNGFSR